MKESKKEHKDPIKKAYSNDLDIFDVVITGIIIIILIIYIVSKIVK